MNKLLLALLVVLCVGLVVAIFFPIYAVKVPSDKAWCLSNMKQLAVGQLIYLADYDDRFPDRDSWMDATYPYIKREDNYHCPILQKGKPAPQIYGYCFNGEMSKAKLPAKDADKIPLLFESDNVARNASGPFQVPNPGRHRSVGSEQGANNVVYVDAHARSIDVP